MKAFFDKIGAETQEKHQRGGEHEQDLALRRCQQISRNVLNPAVRAEFDRAHKRVSDEKDEEQPGTKRKSGHDRDHDQQRARNAIRYATRKTERTAEE